MKTHLMEDDAGRIHEFEADDGLSIAFVVEQARKELGFPVKVAESSGRNDQGAIDDQRRLRIRAEEERGRAEKSCEAANARCERLTAQLEAAKERADKATESEKKTNLLRLAAVEGLNRERAMHERCREELAAERAKCTSLEERNTWLLAEGKKAPEMKERAAWAGTVTVESSFPDGRFKELRFEPK